MDLRIGVDLGGTKTEAVALAADGSERARIRVPTPRSYEESLDAVAGLVARVEEQAGGRGTVGVGIPGAISPASGVVKNANSTWLIGKPLATDLGARLGRPVRVMNDANCFALSEAADGAGAGVSSVFGVILGTGVGGGIVLDGRIVQGAQLVAGEWGHNPLPWPSDDERPGPLCYCGKRGCIETFVSGPGLEAAHERRTGRRVPAVELGARSASGDAEATVSLSRYVDRLARGLATVVNLLDPEVIVLGGGVSNLPGLARAVRGALAAWVFTDELATDVRGHVHGDSSGVRGAARLW